ncbi:MAG TPA: hypothetical protein VER12_18665 [Polyangiaceae bacterium]|nr:hypothetical protein [Polyangiaceae bacterium]
MRLRAFVFSSVFAAATATGCVPDERPGSSSRPGSSAASGKPATRLAEEPGLATGRALPARASQADPELGQGFADTFDRADPGADWNITGAGWTIKEGRLCVSNAHNHPAWLRRRLPPNARIEFEATSASPDGDLKAEAWGDGLSAATGKSYINASSYLVIFGGWKNSLHALARLDEHGADRKVVHVEPGETDPRAQPVLPDRAYRFKIERADGKTVRYFVDEIEILSLKDPSPLTGVGHEHFGFNDWEVPACFDNLTITPLKS